MNHPFWQKKSTADGAAFPGEHPNALLLPLYSSGPPSRDRFSRRKKRRKTPGFEEPEQENSLSRKGRSMPSQSLKLMLR